MKKFNTNKMLKMLSSSVLIIITIFYASVLISKGCADINPYSFTLVVLLNAIVWGLE